MHKYIHQQAYAEYINHKENMKKRKKDVSVDNYICHLSMTIERISWTASSDI